MWEAARICNKGYSQSQTNETLQPGGASRGASKAQDASPELLLVVRLKGL